MNSFFPLERIAVTDAALATRDSRTELGIDTICARPSPFEVGDAVAGEAWSRHSEGVVSAAGKPKSG